MHVTRATAKIDDFINFLNDAREMERTSELLEKKRGFGGAGRREEKNCNGPSLHNVAIWPIGTDVVHRLDGEGQIKAEGENRDN